MSESPKKILIIEDEAPISNIIKYNLKKEGYEVDAAFDGGEGLKKALAGDVDLILLDIMLPVMDGFEVCKQVREKSNVPILMLTAKEEEVDKVLGLELGADDYLCKPFSVKELIARIHVILRRCSYSKEKEKILKVGNVCLDLLSYEAFINNQKISMTVTEFRILKAFIEHNGEVLSREQLIEIAYPDDIYLNDRAVDCHIKRLRKKIDENYIQTIYGLGYKGNFDA